MVCPPQLTQPCLNTCAGKQVPTGQVKNKNAQNQPPGGTRGPAPLQAGVSRAGAQGVPRDTPQGAVAVSRGDGGASKMTSLPALGQALLLSSWPSAPCSLCPSTWPASSSLPGAARPRPLVTAWLPLLPSLRPRPGWAGPQAPRCLVLALGAHHRPPLGLGFLTRPGPGPG